MRIAILALLFIGFAFSFEVGQLKEGKVSVFCPGYSKVAVAGPDGLHFVELDEYGEGSFAPKVKGDYSFQCGNQIYETTFDVQDAKAEFQTANEQLGLLAFGFSLVFVALMAASAFYLAGSFLAENKFYKEIKEETAELVVVAGKSLSKIKIVDPVCMHAKTPITIEIPFLKAGAVWKYRYEFPKGGHPLPASLEAQQEGNKVRLLSQLIPTNAWGQKETLRQSHLPQPKVRGVLAQKKVRLPRYQAKTKEE
ncbi:MAG: hypothetical protein QXT25_00925 [Candidatus Anstonellaceae archaeon]